MALAVAPGFVGGRAAGIDTVMVTGTNGKTTTTAFLVDLLAGVDGPETVVANRGSNLPGGVAAALASAGGATSACFEVDEAYVPKLAEELQARVLIWLNMSRDQLDRSMEVRKLSRRVGDAGRFTPVLVANAGDPAVVANSGNFEERIWIAGAPSWRRDATACPACGGRIDFGGSSWRCQGCDLRQPEASYSIDGAGRVTGPGGKRLGRILLEVPGDFNLFNALAAAVAAGRLRGLRPEHFFPELSRVGGVGGRFTEWVLSGLPRQPKLTTYLAKNPAGWEGILDLVPAGASLVLGLNARVADGKDTSWIWDADLERLAGMVVIATGERAGDMAFRLEVAGCRAARVPDQLQAVALAGAGGGRVVYLGNYTAFFSLVDSLGRLGALRSREARAGVGS